jgi:hypothetical protein
MELEKCGRLQEGFQKIRKSRLNLKENFIKEYKTK